LVQKPSAPFLFYFFHQILSQSNSILSNFLQY